MKARAGKKPVVLELGGNAAAVLEDYQGSSELEKIIPKLIFGAYYQSGQSCISLQRLFVRHVSRFLIFSRCTTSINVFLEQPDKLCRLLHSHLTAWL